MKHGILITIVLAHILNACEDKLSDIIYEKEEIKGVALLTDSFRLTPDTVATEATIYLSENPDTENYLLKTKTDTEGEFSFSHRPAKEDFYIVGQYKNKEGIVFKGATHYTAFSGSLSLSPQYPGEKIQLYAQDSKNQPVQGAEVYLFINKEQALSINRPAVTGFIRKGLTNQKGAVFFYQLSPGEYYIAGKYGNLAQRLPLKVTLLASGTQSETLTLSLPPELKVEIKDSTDQPVFNAEVHVFSSQNQAGSILWDTPASFRKAATDRDGVVTFTELTSGGIYYLGVRYPVMINDSLQIRANRGGAVQVKFPQQVIIKL